MSTLYCKIPQTNFLDTQQEFTNLEHFSIIREISRRPKKLRDTLGFHFAEHCFIELGQRRDKIIIMDFFSLIPVLFKTCKKLIYISGFLFFRFHENLSLFMTFQKKTSNLLEKP